MPLLFFSFIFIFIFSFFWWGSPHHQVLVHWRFNEIFPPVMAAIKGTAVDPLGLAVDPFFFLIGQRFVSLFIGRPDRPMMTAIRRRPCRHRVLLVCFVFFFRFAWAHLLLLLCVLGFFFFFAKIYWHTKIMAGSRCTAPGNDEHVTSRGRTRKKIKREKKNKPLKQQ